MNEYIKKIQDLMSDQKEIRIMEVCGGHTNTIMKYGIRDILPNNLKLISGPGCPVCVTSQHDIDSMVHLALFGVKVATYGDMLNVPGTTMSLKDAQAQGADVKMVYSVDDVPKDYVFFATGFETTTPMTAFLLNKGIKVFSTHKVMPPAMKAIVEEMDIDGFIDPGHVSAITGSKLWDDMNLNIPQVIVGFNPDALLKAIYELLVLIKNKDNKVLNSYEEVVSVKGNEIAQKLINEQLVSCDSEWRGIGNIPLSGLIPRNPKLDARIVYKDLLKNVISKENAGCRCGEVIKGLIEPKECPLFGKVCTPDDPKGACMVSETEGACGIAYKYGRSLSE